MPIEPVDRHIDPARYQTLENTTFTSVIASPSYSRDHTVFAAGSCAKRSDCRVLFLSTDGGATWRRLPAKSFAGEQLLLPPTYPADPRIFAMGPMGLQRSTDGGLTFETVSPLWGYAAISPAFGKRDQRILIGSNAILEYSADSGLTTPTHLPLPPGRYTMVAFSPSHAVDRVTIVGGGQTSFPAGLSPVAYRCTQSNCQRLDLEDGHLLFVLFAHDEVYAFTDRGLFVSRDDAKSFHRLTYGTALSGLMGVAATSVGAPKPSLMAAIVRFRSGGLHRSIDGGETWTVQNPALEGFENGVRQVLPTPTGRLIVAGASTGMACSEDDGRTWTRRCRPEI